MAEQLVTFEVVWPSSLRRAGLCREEGLFVASTMLSMTHLVRYFTTCQ